jgi:hypothetical protein
LGALPYLTFRLPVLPVVRSTNNVCGLRPFVSAAQEQNNFGASDAVVHAIACTNVDSQLPNAISNRLVVAEVTEFDTIDAAINGSLSLDVA